MIRCKCNRLLIPELQKGKYYYRCHNKKCDIKSFTENKIDKIVSWFFQEIQFTEEGAKNVIELIKKETKDLSKNISAERQKINNKINKLDDQLSNLIKMKAENLISDRKFKKENNTIEEEIEVLENELQKYSAVKRQFFTWDSLIDEEKALLIKIVCSNCYINSENSLILEVFDEVNFEKMTKKHVGIHIWNRTRIYSLGGSYSIH